MRRQMGLWGHATSRIRLAIGNREKVLAAIQALEAGAKACAVKPFTSRVILRAIRNVLQPAATAAASV